jgi:hypothetical protein
MEYAVGADVKASGMELSIKRLQARWIQSDK